MARSVIVTGGFGILGQAVAEAFAAAGDKVARIDFAPAAAKAISGTLDIGGVDLTDAAATGGALDSVRAAHGGIDVLVNVAGGFTWETLEGGSIESWARMQSINLISNATITKAALADLKASSAGRIISIGAGAAITWQVNDNLSIVYGVRVVLPKADHAPPVAVEATSYAPGPV